MRLDRQVTDALNATGRQWRAEQGKRHVKLFIDNRLIGILPNDGKMSEGAKWAGKNLLAQIRRVGRDSARP